MNLKKALYIIAFVLECTPLLSQIVPSEKYTSKNGLISDRITAIAQDDKGFMWFGSYFGICIYDGIKFEKIALPEKQQNKYVYCLVSAGKKMYAGFLFGGGLAEYFNGKVSSYFIQGKDSLSENDFGCIVYNNDGSILLCNSSNNIYQFKNGTFTFLLNISSNVLGDSKEMLKDRFNNIWIANERGIFISPFPYKKTYHYFKNENIFSLVKDKNDVIWFSRTNGTRTITQTSNGWLNELFINEKIISTSLRSKVVPFSGNTGQGLWGIDETNGLFNLSIGGKKVSYQVPVDYTTDLKLIFADRENNIWIANDPGIIKISNFEIQSYLFNETAAGGGDLLLANDSTIWVSNSKSLYAIHDNIIKKKELIFKIPNYFGLLHYDQDNNLWVGLWNEGLLRMRWQSGRLAEQEYLTKHNQIIVKASDAVNDKKGNTWIIGSNGIFQFRNKIIKSHFQPQLKTGIPAFVNCFTIDEDNNTLWLGDNSTGIIKVKYELDKNNVSSYRVEDYIGMKEGLSDRYIRSIYIDWEKNIWVGTRFGGIFRIKEKGDSYLVESCNKEAEITCARITDIVPEDTSALWFATCNGIYRYMIHNKKWQHFNTSNGLLNAEVYRIAVDSKNGYIWAVSSQGVSKFRTNSIKKTTVPLINITSISVLGKNDSSALLSTHTTYSSGENSIGFSFAGASFIDEKKISYKYMLEGYNKEWSSPVFTNSVNYGSLPPGKYVFKVLAANAEGQWSTHPATFQFTIVQPFYKNPVLIFLAITLGIFILYVVRIQRLKQRFKIEKIRLNIARDLHDDIGSTLGSINLLSKNATRKMTNNFSQEEIVPIFQKIGDSAENILDAMDDIVWSINPNKDKVYDLFIRMREFAIPLFEAKDITFTFKMDGEDELPVPMHLRRNVFLIYKESVYNILKHAEASAVSVELHISAQHFSMSITDNGKGLRDLVTTSDRHGIKNMQGRAELVKGNIQVQSSSKGTTIILKAPIR